MRICYFPFDFWWFSALAWRKVQPDLVILIEGERWPEHVHQACCSHVPVLSVNARLSDRSFRWSLKFCGALAAVSTGITRVLCATRTDTEQFLQLGFPAARVETIGNLKLDVAIPRLSVEEKNELRRELGLAGELILLGSSTWPGEESALLQALHAARTRRMSASLLLVPRHAERREELRALFKKSGLTFHFRSDGCATGLVDVAVGDTTGELRRFTQLADLVFTGKSLAPHRGRTDPGGSGDSL